MQSPERNRVLIDGSLNRKPFTRRQMVVNSFGSGTAPSEVRAVVLVAGDVALLAERARIVRWARQNFADSMNAGYGCFIAAKPAQLNAVKQTLAATDDLSGVPVVLADADVVAQRCLRHDPGPTPD